jgi:cell division protein ZipA
MGIKTVIVLSILAMAFGLFLLFVWIDQRRQQKRLRAIARYNRERQQQNRLDTKGPKVIDLGNKRVIIDPLVDGFEDDEVEFQEQAAFLTDDFKFEAPASSEMPKPTVIISKISVSEPPLSARPAQQAAGFRPSTLSAQRINPYAKVTQGHESHRPKSYSTQAQDQCCPHTHDDEDFLSDEDTELQEMQPEAPKFQNVAAENQSPKTETETRSTASAASYSATAPSSTASTAKSTQTVPDYLTFSLMAEKGKPFGGYDLLQSILGSGMRHGERQIFHRYDTHEATKILFSMASIAKPGTFAVESMGSFSTPGLIFIFEIERTPDLLNSFELLLETARQLSEDLDGNLLDDRREPLTTERIQALRQQLRAITPVADFADED